MKFTRQAQLPKQVYQEIKGEQAIAYFAVKNAKQQKQRWCQNHPFSFWGKDYTQCVQGFKLKEECIEGK